MDLEEADQWLNSSSDGGPSILDYAIGIDPIPLNPGNQEEEEEEELDWDPKTMLTNLSFLEQKIHHLQNLVHLMAAGRGTDFAVQQQKQHLVTADVTSIIAQLISAAGSLLPSARQNNNNVNINKNNNNNNNNNNCNNINKNNNNNNNTNHLDDHELKDEEDAEEGESLAPGTYEILQLEKEEILAPHTHFCAICGKGFKRDANLRMHMRGHGDEYKTPAALAKPHRDSLGPPEPKKRYSCPFAGCKRNRDHKKFQPLKTILCVKNHYKRTHCDKSYACSRCKTKKFSVIADLKTHEKHCGRDKWLCSCGTTFSRKDKLFGHISLFQGHTPAIPADETKPTAAAGSVNFGFGSDSPAKIGVDDDQGALFSPIDFESCNFGGFHEFPRPPYEDSLDESSFSFLLAGSCSNYPPKSVRDSDSNNLA